MKNKTLEPEKYYAKIKKLNQEHYAGEVAYYSKASLRPAEIVLLGKLDKKSRILDLGCGSGRFSIGAAKKGFEVEGVDITPEAIEASKNRALENNLSNVNFTCGDMTEIPFPDSSFDFVFCPRFSINAVSTRQQRIKAVREMLRVVKSGGVVHIESFNKLYCGKGLWMPLKNVLIDFGRNIKIVICKIFGKEYEGLLPGDITYEANKVATASIGYAHLPTYWQIKKWIPKKTKFDMKSIPEVRGRKKIDLLKYFRYSIWVFIKK